MRNALLPFLALLLISISSCQRPDNVQEMLQDETERRQVYSTILEDEQMRNEMMALMRDQNMGAGMTRSGGIIGDTAGMARVHRQQMQIHMQQVMQLCERDTVACNEMSRMVLQHRGMRTSMLQQMQRQGMLDSTSVQKLRQAMNQ